MAEMDGLVERVVKWLNTSKKMLQYPGGDWYILDDLLQVIMAVPCRRCVLVEVFGGSGLVSQYASRVKFKNVVYNDKDNLLAELHRFVKENPQVLREVLSLIPYSRYVHDYVTTYLDRHADELFGLVAASFLFYAVNTSRNGMISGGLMISKTISDSPQRKYASKINSIIEASRRLRDVTIENMDFGECIKRYDSEETLFYLDPPYVSTEEIKRDYYRVKFDGTDIRRLVSILNGVRGFYLLKVHEDQLRFYDGLKYRWSTKIEKKTHMVNLREEDERDTWRIVLLANYEVKRRPVT